MSQYVSFHQDQYPPLSMADLSPESPDSVNMHGLGRSPEAGIQPFGQYPSLAGHAGGPVGDLHFANSHGHPGFTQNYGQGSMNDPFRLNRGDEPWNPLMANAGPMCGDPRTDDTGTMPPSQVFLDFGGAFRYAVPPSEVDTVVSRSVAGILSDSGYGSMARQSVGNPSVYGGDLEQSAETQSLIQQFQRGMAHGSMSSDEEPRKQEGRAQTSASANRNANGLACPVCNYPVKTNSEMKKHEARHNKPHKCDVPGCPKATEGFSTNNDLERHKRCVHKFRKYDETVYRCDVGPCRDKHKDWPRQDNFRQHLKRKHGLEVTDLAHFTHRSSSPAYLPSLRTPDAVVPEASTALASNPNSPGAWIALSNGRLAPPRLLHGDAKEPRFAHSGNMVLFSAHAPLMEEGAFASLSGGGEPQCQGQTSPDNAHPQLDMDPVFSGSSMPPAPRAASVASSEASPPVDEPACIAPTFLNRGVPGGDCLRPQDIYLQSREAMPLEMDGPAVAQEEPRLEYQEAAEGAMSNDVSVDESGHDAVVENGVDGSDEEDGDAPNSPNDEQADIPADCEMENPIGVAVYTKASPAGQQMAADTPKPADFDDETKASAMIQSLMEKGMLDQILMKVGYQKASEADQNLPTTGSSAAADNGRVNKCDDCHKTFQRRCELKKHRKRHEKPYACTFPKCDKKFGSKNDWKRHENSQHFQLEIWRCAERQPADHADHADDECGKVCHRRESLKSHLEREHGVRDPAAVDRKLADCRMGRNFESRFWCGFCQRTIEPTGTGGPAHGERFDHIDDHFNGRGGLPKADIKGWKHVDPDFADPAAAPPRAPVKGGRSARSRLARAPQARKRPLGSDGADSERVAKRARSGAGNQDVYWTCCLCGNYWSVEVTVKCMDSCNHTYCDHCEAFENNSTEKIGLMT